ncbi:MAG: alpha/beta fold hydrolase [Actinomycetota bacterium]
MPGLPQALGRVAHSASTPQLQKGGRHHMLRERHVQLDGVRLNFAEGPDSGPPLVLLHGGSNRWQRWESILSLLIERWHVFAPDLRGHGGSSWTHGDYTIRSFTDDVVAFLDRAVLEPPALFGHSLGAEVAVWAAARRPGRVRALVVGDGAFTCPGAEPMIERQRAAGLPAAIRRLHGVGRASPAHAGLPVRTRRGGALDPGPRRARR